MTDLKVVDLGTKMGNAINAFLKRGKMYFGDDVSHIQPAECLGIDKKDKYRGDVEGQGFQFQCADVTAGGFIDTLPEAWFYLGWHFLEHLPSKEWSTAFVKVMLHRASKGVWFELPSFEQDESTGEGALKKLGLRFSWTDWHGHPSHYLIEDCVGAINAYKQDTGRSVSVKVKPGKRIRNTMDKKVVPIDSPIDTGDYKPVLGKKENVEFDPPLVGHWIVIAKM